jgi:hypothetical protein
MDNNDLICSVCHKKVLPVYYFCPNCGNNLKATPARISVLMQIGYYALALLLPPLGLWPGVKCMMKKSPQARWVGIITIVLTLISSGVTIWGIFVMFNTYVEQLNSMIYGI